MNLTMKQVFASLFALSAVGLARGEGESYDTTDYVQTGLIAHWDAVENAGRGQQDESIASWRDLTGTHDDLVFPKGAVVGVDANGVRYYDLKSNHYCWLSSCADIARAVLDKSCTVEIVCDFGSQVHDTTVISLLGDTTSKRLLWVRSGERGGVAGCIGSFEYLGTAYYAAVPIDNGCLNAVRAYTLVCGSSACEIYRNGETTGKTVAANGLTGVDSSTVSLAFGNYRAASTVGGSYADMKIYAVRIYNRELKESEILQNAAIDQARLFEGRFRLSQKSLIIAGDPLELGVPSPAYGVGSGMPGEETTCTASEPVDTDVVSFSCIGYQLYTNSVEDALTWLPWGEQQTDDSVTFTFPESDVRLVWLWQTEVKEQLPSAFTGSYCSGNGAVDVWYTIGDFAGIPEIRVSLKYGETGGALDQTADGGVITPGGTVRAISFGGFKSGRQFCGKLVFTIGDNVVSETDVFDFSTGGRLLYWPLNASTRLDVVANAAIHADQSGNGYNLVVNLSHVLMTADAAAPDGECARLDGSSSYLKSEDNLQLSQADGLTFFFRMKGCRDVDSTAKQFILFETSPNYNNMPGALIATVERKDDEWYLSVGENSGSGFAIYQCTTPLAESSWQTVAIVFTKRDAPDCFAVYVDGIRQELECPKGHNASMKNVSFANSQLFVGGRSTSGTMVGDLDEFGIYGYALDADEIAKLAADLSAERGTLFVEAADASAKSMRPLAGAHSGFVAGQVVAFDRKGANGGVGVWSLLEYDEPDENWTLVKRGYGSVGTFTHTGGRMRLCWDIDKASMPICRWAFDDQTGRNTGRFGEDCDLEFSGNVAADDGYLAVPKEETAFAATKNNLPLSSADGLTLSFWARDLDKRSEVVLMELSENYNGKNGCFMLVYDQSKHAFDMAWHYGSYSYEGCSLGSGDVLTDGNWHHCAVVFRKDVWQNIDFYMDGVQLATDSGGRANPLAQDMTNAKFADDYKFYLCHRNTANTMKADLDNVTLYPQSLTASDVAALYAVERLEKGGAVITVPSDAATLTVAAKKTVPTGDLPIPGLGPTCLCTAGETLSFDFTRGPYTVEGLRGRYRLTGWTLYRLIDGEWTVYQAGANPLVEFVHPGGAVKLELKFGAPGLAIIVE